MTAPSRTPRREFLGQLAAGVALASAACAPAVASAPAPAPTSAPTTGAAPVPPAPPAQQKWDDSWVAKVSAAKYRAVFDGPALADGEVAGQAWAFMKDTHDALGAADAEMAAVLVMRHAGIPFALNDVLWDRYKLGKRFKVQDPTTGKPARRNPLLHSDKDDKYALVAPDGTLTALKARGATLLACNRALRFAAYEISQQTKQSMNDARAEVFANLVDGVIVQPSGVYAVLRAQEAGCAYIRSA